MSLDSPRRSLIAASALVFALLTLLALATDRGRPLSVIQLPRGTEACTVVAPSLGYAFERGFGLRVLDLGSPSGVKEVGRLPLEGVSAHAVAADRHRLLVAAGRAGVLVIDVSDPRSPKRLGVVQITGGARHIRVAGRVAFVAAERGGLQLLDLEAAGLPAPLGRAEIPGRTLAVEVWGTYALVAADDYGLRVIDVSDPLRPLEVGWCFLAGSTAVDVAADGDFAYVAGGYGGLRVVDLSEPSRPAEIGGLESAEAWGVAIARDRVLVAAAEAGVLSIPRWPPTGPQPVISFPGLGRAVGIEVSGRSAVVVDDLDGVRILDLDDDEIFSDGFETGDTSAWSNQFPPDGWVNCGLVTISDLREGGNSQIATLSNGLEVALQITRTRYTFPLFDPSDDTWVDYFSISENSHFSAYWDGTGYSPVDVATEEPSFARVDPLSVTTWYVDLDGDLTWPEYWNGTYEVCLELEVVDTGFRCADICTSKAWISTQPTWTPTRTATVTPTPTITPTPPPATPTPAKKGAR